MDGQRFDELTKSLTAAGTSRRRVLRGLLGGAVGALGAALGRRRSGAQGCSAYGRVCTYTNCCRDGAECVCYQNGHCRCLCPTGTSFSNGACVAPTTTTTTTTVAPIPCPPNLVCGVVQAPCGSDNSGQCSSVRSVAASTCICGNDACGPECGTDADCQSYAPGAICQAPETGCCGQRCIAPCGAFDAALLRQQSTGSNSGG